MSRTSLHTDHQTLNDWFLPPEQGQFFLFKGKEVPLVKVFRRIDDEKAAMASSLLTFHQEEMMKIDPNLIIGAVTGKSPVSRPTGGSGNFEDILIGVQKTDTKEAASIQPIPQMNQLNPYKVNALTFSEQAIDMLDTYSKALIDPSFNLKSLAPMVEDLDGMRSKLLDAGSFISDDDPLRGIINDTASTLSGEVMRFRRGDLTG